MKNRYFIRQVGKDLRRVRLLVCIFSVFLFVVPSAVLAETDQEIREENKKIEKQREEIRLQKEEAVEGVSDQEKTVEDLASELRVLDSEVSKLSAKVSAEESKLRSAQIQVGYINKSIEDKEEKIAEMEFDIIDQAVTEFQFSGVDAIDSENVNEDLRMRFLFESVTESQVDDINELEDLVGSLEQEKAMAVALEAEVLEAKTVLEEEKGVFETAQEKQAALVIKAEDALEARYAEIAVLAEREKEFSDELKVNNDELNKRLARAAAQKAAESSSSGNYSSSGGKYEVTDSSNIVRVQGIQIHVSMAKGLDDLLNAARADGIELAGWGYRDSKRQIELRRQNCGSSNYAIYSMSSSRCRPPTARPGRSNHERGMAVDFTYKGSTIKSQNTVPFRWMRANAGKYGFKNLPSEPWHWSIDGN